MLILLLAYLGGVLTILSPCILPVLPFVFSRASGPFLKNGLPLLVGMALTFAGVSTLAAVGGGWAVHANEWGRWIALALLALFAVTLLFPALADRLSRPLVALGSRLTEQTSAQANIGQSVLLGVATGLLWAPCAGPILGLILTASALGGPTASSTFLLLAYALGAATSLAVVLAAGGRLIAAFKRSQTAEEWIRRIIGVAVLIGVIAVAFGLDRGVLANLSGPQTTTLEQSLINKLTPSDIKHPEPSDILAKPIPAPSLAGGGPWFNSPPLTMEGLRGKVVLVDFWTYSCINCMRSLPYVEAWEKRYRDQGLVVIGIHTPEFAFEKIEANVAKAIKDFNVRYPVVMDNDRKLWKAFDNSSWPAHFFIDARGLIRAEHDGEGGYDKSEAFLRTLLAERNGRPVDGAPVQVKGQGVEYAPDFDNAFSQERYLGYKKADGFASAGGFANDTPKTYALPDKYAADAMGYAGVWTVGAEQSTAVSAGNKIVMLFHARDLNMVLGPSMAGRTIRFRVTLNGKPPGPDHGVDVDEGGNGVVTGQRLYQLIRQRAVGDKDTLFQIEFIDPGVQAYSFTFG